jgi:hypothetical protein
MIMISILYLKDIDLWNGLKNKTHMFSACNKSTSLTKTNTDVNDGKRYFDQMDPGNK